MWYSEGTVAVTNGGTNVTGTGTSFLTNARVGDGITITGSTALHEVVGVTSNTQLSIRPAYAGTTGSGRTYGISPLLGYDKDLSDAFNQLRLQFGDQLSNLQPWASANTAQEARNQLEASSSGNTLFTGTLSQAQSHLQVQGVAGRGVVGGGEDLMTVGAFGLGAPTASFTAHFNDYVTPGFYSFEATPNNTSNGPLSSAYGTLLIYRRQSQDRLMQELNSILGGSGQRFFRIQTSSGWSSWSEVYHQRTILGTVSQSDGVPTGAIIERGSNANGDYVKFADGTLVCTVVVPLGSIVLRGSGTRDNPYRTDNQDGSWAHSFLDSPAVSALGVPDSAIPGATRTLCQAHLNRVSSTGYYTALVARSTTNASEDPFSLFLTAIGRWY